MMSYLMRQLTAALFLLVFSVSQVFAAQSFTTEADGSISFSASTSSVTRISVKGDRIRRIVNDDTSFEMTNDETTGDVFLRFSGGASVSREQGYIVTEKGVTIGYSLRPTNQAVEPVIITVKGATGPATAASESPSDTGDFSAGVGFSDNVAQAMTEIARKVYAENLFGVAPSGSDGRVFKRVSGSGWRATIRVATAGSSGRLVREQEFYTSRVSGVIVIQPQLAPNQRTFVIVMEIF